jgi:hypothetical protein
MDTIEEYKIIEGQDLGSLTEKVNAAPVGVGAVSQLWTLTGEQSLLQTRIATTESVSLRVRMTS